MNCCEFRSLDESHRGQEQLKLINGSVEQFEMVSKFSVSPVHEDRYISQPFYPEVRRIYFHG